MFYYNSLNIYLLIFTFIYVSFTFYDQDDWYVPKSFIVVVVGVLVSIVRNFDIENLKKCRYDFCKKKLVAPY